MLLPYINVPLRNTPRDNVSRWWPSAAPIMWKARRVVGDVRKLRRHRQTVIMCQKMITSATPN